MSNLLVQTRHRLTRSIAASEFRSGSVLPPKSELARRFNCSEATVERALTDLARRGVVRRVRRKGTVVVGLPTSRRLGRAVLLQSPDEHTNRLLTEPVYSALVKRQFDVDVVPMTADPNLAADRCEDLAGRTQPAEFMVVLGLPKVFSATPEPMQQAMRRVHAAIERLPWRVRFDVAQQPTIEGEHQVVVDQVHAVRLVVEHLLKLGHRRIAVEAGHTPGENAWPEHSAHLARHIIELAGGSMAPLYMTQWNDEHQLHDWYQRHRPTALWAITDYSAMLMSNLLARKGVMVPRDLSVIGRNDTPWCATVVPELSSVSINPQGIAAAIAGVLADAAEQGHMPAAPLTMVDPQLVVRQSTAPLRDSR